MRLILRALCLVAVLALSAAAQPQIYTNGVVNGAGFVFAPMPNGAIAQGSIFSIFGGSMGPATPYPAPSFPLQAGNGLAGYTVEITPPGGGSTIFAIPLMVSLGQINAILPSSVPEGLANVVVRYNRVPSSPQQIRVVKRSFGVFTANRAGSGPASLQNWYSSTNQLQNSVNEVAHPGQVVVLWGTGLGPVTFDETLKPGANAKDMKDEANVTVYVAGIPVKPEYAGRSPEFAGVDQINFTLPANLPTACYVPVTVMVDGVVSNTATMSIASSSGPGQTCSDDFTALPARNQPLRSGNIMLTHVSGAGAQVDTATASFTRIAAENVITMHGNFGVSTYGACSVFNYKGDAATFAEPFTVNYLNAGTSLTLTLPDNTTRALIPPPAALGVYSVQATGPAVPLSLVPGTYKIDVPGGGNVAGAVGNFHATVTVPQPLVWNNSSSITNILRTSDLPITWTGGADAVLIAGSSSFSDKTGAGFYCLARASDHHFTIPAYVLSALPPSSGSGSTSTGQLSVGDFPTAARTRVSPPPSGLDSATFGYQFLTAKTVVFQ